MLLCFLCDSHCPIKVKQKGIESVIGHPSVDDQPLLIMLEVLHANIYSPSDLVHQLGAGLIVTEALCHLQWGKV